MAVGSENSFQRPLVYVFIDYMMYDKVSKNYTARAWLIWALAAGFFFSEYFARVAPSVMVADLMRAFHVNALSLGTLSAFFYFSYVAMQLPVGTLVDRYGAHKLLTIMALLCGLASFIFAMAHSLALADFARFLMGLAAAFAFVGTLKLVRVWFPINRLGFLAGITQGIGMLGAAVGEGPVAVVVKHVGWRFTMVLIGALLVLLGILIYIFVRDTPPNVEPDLYASKRHSLWSNVLDVVKLKQCWINSIFVGFLYAPTAAFAELWGASYIHRVYNIRADIAATAISVIFIGFAIGSPLLGFVSDKLRRRKPVMLFSAIASMIFLSAALYLPNIPVWALFVILFLYGMSNVGVATCYAVAGELVHPRLAGTSMALANMASVMVGSYLFQPLIGWLLDVGSHHRMVQGVPVYSIHDFRMAMLTLPFCFIVSIVAWFFLRESFVRER